MFCQNTLIRGPFYFVLQSLELYGLVESIPVMMKDSLFCSYAN